MPDYLEGAAAGTLEELEHIVAVTEQAPSLEAAADVVSNVDSTIESVKPGVLNLAKALVAKLR